MKETVMLKLNIEKNILWVVLKIIASFWEKLSKTINI